MIIPAYNHNRMLTLDGNKSFRLVTTREGTILELWSNRYDRPYKNGKICRINTQGELEFYKDVNKLAVATDDDGKIICKNGE